VEQALSPTLSPVLRAQLAAPEQGSLAGSLAREGRERDVRTLLSVLRPELDGAAVLGLPPRMRALVARLVPTAQRKALREDKLESRAGFDLDEDLRRLLLRIARRAATLESA
jgi:hypothetical protein